MNNKMNKESNQYLIDSLREDHKRVYKQIIEEIDKVINISYSAIDNFGSIAKNESKNYYDNIETEFNDINEDIINLKISFDKTRELKNRVTEFTNAINKVLGNYHTSNHSIDNNNEILSRKRNKNDEIISRNIENDYNTGI